MSTHCPPRPPSGRTRRSTLSTARAAGCSLAVAGLVAACGTGGGAPGAAADRAAWMRALGQPTPAATASCGEILELGLKGECMVGVASAAATAGDRTGADAACAALAPGMWRDECGFAVADALMLRGDQALAACASAGRYREHCRGHVLTAAVARMDDLPLAVGEEDELVLEIRRRVDASGVRLPRRHRATVVFTGAARHIAGRSREGVFSRGQCGVAPVSLCVRAYQETMQQGMDRVDRAGICTGPLDSARVAAAGGTPWEASAQSVAERGWDALCKAWNGQERGP